MLLVFQGSDVLIEDFLQLFCLCVVVHHLALDKLSHLHLLLAIEGKSIGCTLLALLTADDVVVTKEFNHLFHLILDSEARGLHVVDKERRDIVNRGREDQLVGLRDIANHKEHVGHTDGEACLLRTVGLVGASHTQGIVHRLLATSLQAFLEHVVIEFVEGDELAQFGFRICLGSGVNHLDDASLVSLYLLRHIAEGEERVEHLHNQLELIRHERIVVHEILLRVVATIRCWQLELQVETSLILVVKRGEFRLHLLFFVENTFLRDDLRLCAFKGHLHLETPLDLAFLVFLLGNITVVHNLGEVLLGGASHPYLIIASLREFGDNLLQVEITVALLVDKLTHLVGKENQAIVIALIFQVGSQFHTEAVDAHVGVALDDALTDTVYGECRSQFLGNVEHPVQLVVDEVGSHAGVVPVATFFGDALLEGFEYALLCQRLFKILRQSDVEFIEASLAVELVPEDMEECLLLVGGVVVAGFEVEDAGVDGGTLQPVGDRCQLLIVETEIVLFVEWVNGFHGFKQTSHCILTSGRRDAVVKVFQEVRLTRTIVTVNPDAHMVVGLVVLDGIEYAEETVDNFVRKHIFLYFYPLCLWVELGCADGRIDSAVDRLAI